MTTKPSMTPKIIMNQSEVNMTPIIRAMAANTLDSETYFDSFNVIKKVDTKSKNSNGLAAKIAPPPVATAFPPLNFKKIE